MADCYYHGQSSPGLCPDCIQEGRIVQVGTYTYERVIKPEKKMPKKSAKKAKK